MIPPTEFFRSVEAIWLLWLISAAVVGVMTIVGVARLSLVELRRLWRCERGAAYSLSYVLTVPFYVIFVCLVIESTHILVAKVGTVYSAYAGARSGVVWCSATSPADAQSRMQTAARQAFVPFANGDNPDQRQVVEAEAPELHRVYLEAYRRRADNPGSGRYLLAKYAYAEQALTAEDDVAGRPPRWDSDIRVTVRYQFRFHVPVIAQILGSPGGDGHYYYQIASTVALQNEGPQNEEQRLGIRYASPD